MLMASCANPLPPLETKVIDPQLAAAESVSSSDWIVTGAVLTRNADRVDIKVVDIVKPGPNPRSVATGQTISIETTGVNTSSIEPTDIFCFSDGPTHRLEVDASRWSVPGVKRILAGDSGQKVVPSQDEIRRLMVGTGRSLAYISYQTSSIYGTDARIVRVREPIIGPAPRVGDTIHQERTDRFDLGRTNRLINDIDVNQVAVLERTATGWTIVEPSIPSNLSEETAFLEQLKKEVAQP